MFLLASIKLKFHYYTKHLVRPESSSSSFYFIFYFYQTEESKTRNDFITPIYFSISKPSVVCLVLKG